MTNAQKFWLAVIIVLFVRLLYHAYTSWETFSEGQKEGIGMIIVFFVGGWLMRDTVVCVSILTDGYEEIKDNTAIGPLSLLAKLLLRFNHFLNKHDW